MPAKEVAGRSCYEAPHELLEVLDRDARSVGRIRIRYAGADDGVVLIRDAPEVDRVEDPVAIDSVGAHPKLEVEPSGVELSAPVP